VDDRRRQRRIFLALSGALVVALLVASAEILLPFVLGMLVAYLLLPAVLRVEQLRVPRWAAILLVYAVTLGAIGGFIALVVPSLVSEGRALSRDLPQQVQHAQETWLPVIDARLKQWTGQAPEAEPETDIDPEVDGSKPKEDGAGPRDLPRGERADLQIKPSPGGGFDVTIQDGVVIRKTGEETWRLERVEPQPAFSSEAAIKRGITKATKYVTENMGELIKLGQQIVAAVSRGIFNLFMTLMLGGYIMLTHERILDFFRDLVPYESQTSFDRLLRRLDRGLSGVVRGQLIICVVNGVLSAIGFWLFDLKYWPIMAFIAAVGSLIPIFGSILSTIPAVVIGLTQSPGTAVAVLAWVVGIHQLEANFLNPKIIGDSAKIHPVLVVFSLLVGEHFFQIKGALFAVPCLSILQTLFLHFREVTMGLADPMASIPPDAPARSFKLDPLVVPKADRTPKLAVPVTAQASKATGSKGAVEVRPATPAPRTKQSRSASIATTLPAGARIEDVLGDEPDSTVSDPERAADASPPAAVSSTLESVQLDSTVDGRDTEPHSESPSDEVDPTSSDPDIPVVASSTPATVEPRGSEPPGKTAVGQEKPSEKG
jgi:predicted PurR-regulated permease PerM